MDQGPPPKNPQNPVSVRQYVMGLYLVQIKNLFTLYNPEQIHLIWYDDIRDRPEKVLADLCSFLDIDPAFEFRDAESPVQCHPGPEKLFTGVNATPWYTSMPNPSRNFRNLPGGICLIGSDRPHALRRRQVNT